VPQTRGTPNNHYTGESRSFHIFYEQAALGSALPAWNPVWDRSRRIGSDPL